MKSIKLDRRYRAYSRWQFALQFGRPYRESHAEQAERRQYARLFLQLHGPDVVPNPQADWTAQSAAKPLGNRWVINPNWYNDTTRSRIYYNNPADLTLILLLKNGQSNQ